ncbi:MAG: DUF4388 domain-containing protein [Vicinamibacteria bacterium]|nr:DUF4388 domain-containing protein [Vicinamibacteria bacterium]
MTDPSNESASETLVSEGHNDLTFRGDIRGSGTPKILRTILQSGESGVLSFWNGVVTKRVFVSRGRIVQITSNDPDERLGELLLVDGRITARQFVEASKLIRPGKRLGTLLVEISALDPEDLIPAITSQARLMLFELFNWTSGTYEMSLGDLDESGFVPLNLSSDEVIAQGMRTLRCWSRVLAGIQSLEAVFVRVPEVETWHLKVELQDDEQTVLSRVNGRLTVEQIADLSFGTSFETCRTLWMLLVLGLIQRAESGDVERSQSAADEATDRVEVGQIVDRFNRLFERIYAYVDSRPGEGAEAFTEQAIAEIAPHFGALFKGISLKSSGRVDPDQIYDNLRDESLENRRMLVSTGLSELVYAIQFRIRQNYGLQEEAVVSGFIRDGL